jgi:hypothetical protein
MTDELWLPTLVTDTPQAGFELAVKLSRLGAMVEARADGDEGSRLSEPRDPTRLIAPAHLIALNFQIIAAANDWWRRRDTDRSRQ